MSSLNLRTKYNAPNTRKAINRAIRAEFPDGAAVLARAHQMHGRAERLGWWRLGVTRGGDGPVPSREAHAAMAAQAKADEYEAVIRERYGMPAKRSRAIVPPPAC